MGGIFAVGYYTEDNLPDSSYVVSTEDDPYAALNMNRGRVTVPPLFHRLCLSNLHIIYGCCSFAAPISFSWHIDK